MFKYIAADAIGGFVKSVVNARDYRGIGISD
jgi:hypothetical protein